ncbi:alpha/beta hydrolase [Dokdonia pacifica]|uniref:TAP-like protein n=1 Tax=Dokdonia pacifica TaxID=1627892 RepID=A0A238VPL4_9FLAO|nr:alpha/beta fold hydrolase [Dokdonia pacifica]GGG19126.1 alpha/beta hydrolase [Dokdonia pacifica]SNR36312.1 TAP-like protein [Dokdonia pacifica]
MKSQLIFLLCFSIAIQHLFAQKLEITPTTFTSKSGKEVTAEVGTIAVPENRKNPNAAMIPIHFIKLKSTNPNGKTPTFYLEGGPGSSCTWQASNPAYLENWLPYLELGDVVLVDQRGTGAETERTLFIWQKELPKNLFVHAEDAQKHFNNMSQEALKVYKDRGVDLQGYTTIENANDLDALRQALGYTKISLFGFSYGTHLGQTYMKYYPDSVENAVLIGVEGFNDTFKLPLAMDMQLHKIALLSNNDPTINKQVPDLVALYEKVIRKIKEKPVELEITSALTGAPLKVRVGSYGLNVILRIDIGDASDIPVLPRLLYSIDQGDYSLLQWFVQKRHQRVYGIHGMAITMDAASGASPSRLARIEAENKKSLFKNVINPSNVKNWPIPDLGEDFRTPLATDIRTLFLSGTLDFNTPPYQAEQVRWGYSNSQHIIVQNAGHEQIVYHPEAQETILRFLKGETVNDVTMSYPPIQFIPLTGTSEDLWHPSLGDE